MKISTVIVAACCIARLKVSASFRLPSANRAVAHSHGPRFLLQKELRPSFALHVSSPLGLENIATEMAAIVAEAETAPTDLNMGARADPAATGAFVFVALVFGILRLKVAGAMAVKDDRLRAEIALQEAKVAALKGMSSESSGARVEVCEAKIADLKEREESARRLGPGVRIAFLAPSNDPVLREVEERLNRKQRASDAKNEAAAAAGETSKDASAKPLDRPRMSNSDASDPTPLGTGRTLLLAGVGMVLLVLLSFISTDPMTSPSTASGFY